jgi:hypothetical protein
MSGNEPYRSASDESPTFGEPAGGIYGAPKSSHERVESKDFEHTAELVQSLGGEDQSPAARPPAPESAGGLDLRETQDLGNRPASGARVVAVSEVFSEHFIGAEGASDFLGLDTEFDPTPVGLPGSHEFAMADVARATATEEEFQRGYVSPLSPPTPEESYAASAPVQQSPVDDLPPVDPEEPFVGEDLAEEPELVVAGGSRSRTGLAVGVLCLIGAAAAGAWIYAPKLFVGKSAEAPSVGYQSPKPGPAAKKDPPARPLEDFSLTAKATPGEPADSGQAAPVSMAGGDSKTAASPKTVPKPLAPAGGVEPGLPTATELEGMLAQAAMPDSFFQAHTGLLDLVWRGQTVPVEAIESPNRILTPAVGNVRVELDNGSWDGRLYAVGQNKVWLEEGLGRMGLDGTRVKSIQYLADERSPPPGDSAEFPRGERVRARVPGGVIYGYVRSQEANVVTLVTESGARITLVDAVVEPASDPKRVSLKL